jgi:1,4-dihydroxy-2-naphthoate octaprenyltransferase
MIEKLRAWLALSRLPFHSVGVLPFVLGAVLAWRLGGTFRWDVFVWGTLGVVLIMLSTYTAGEYWDIKEDTLSAKKELTSRFAGGSRMIAKGVLPRRAALITSILALVLASGVGVLLQFGYRTGVWTIPFGAIGMVGGFFYSTRPLRWVDRGWGELWIAFCYGWLPVAVSYYLQAGRIDRLVHWLAVPIGLTIFNVILLNEYPDYDADRVANKRNLLARLGRERAGVLYAFAHLAAVGVVGVTLTQGVPMQALWFYLPILLLSLALVALVMRSCWRDPVVLERLCGANLVVNLGTTAAFILSLGVFGS